MVKSDKSWLQKFRESESSTSIVFGAIVVVVVGILLFNYSKSNPSISNLGEATESASVLSPTGMQLPATYTVVNGDTLWAIAAKYYGQGEKWTELVKENNITANGQVEVGQVLRVPVLETEATPVVVAEPTAAPVAEETKTEPVVAGGSYSVVVGDCLWNIAVAKYNDGYKWTKIYEANKQMIADPDMIYPGQALVIPE